MQSARALHRAMRVALESRFFTNWCTREPYTSFHERFLRAVERFSAWPSVAEYDDLARQVPRPVTLEDRADLPRFVVQDRRAVARLGGYEAHVAQTFAVPTRERSFHDFFNMAVWAHFPRVRWALNAIHVDRTLGPIDPRNGRAPEQNIAAQFDESGLIVASSAPDLLAELRALRFKHVFWERRAELSATTCFWVIGHGMLESMLAPHLALSGKAVLLELPRPPASYEAGELRHWVDARVADRIKGFRDQPVRIDPVPLLGIPGYADNAREHFYEDARYFRFQRRSRVPR